ncbi:MAG: hypothetical protein NTU73_12230, partial [Ignavibacteriae bacterium]|nr:hypothetical protein [Ignavibacteriota bacterium]
NNINIIDNTQGKERSSEPIKIIPRYFDEIKKFVESRFIFTNEGSGLTADYYFSRFDEVITIIKPEYAKQHGIIFTDQNLSKFALWFVKEFYEKKLSEKYLVLDPAGGSGNLVMSWKGHLKHKIVCELQPELLRIIEHRMKLDPFHLKKNKNEGLNFLDKSAEKYIKILEDELKEKNLSIDKPFAFLLNPPYKNTDENENIRISTESNYKIDDTIRRLTGDDAGNERYLAFLAQIVNISRQQMGDLDFAQGKLDDIEVSKPLHKKIKEKPLLLIFTPSSWLIPRPTYVPFREVFDKYFKYEMGFIITGNEFFKIQGRFPISFTIWSYNFNEKGNKNKIIVKDLTHLKGTDLDINWNLPDENINKQLNGIWKNSKDINFSEKRTAIQDWIEQKMYDFKRDPTKKELKSGQTYGGLPIKDERRKNKKTYGIKNSTYIGFMDNSTPARIKNSDEIRFSKRTCQKIWFRLDTVFINVNQTKIFSGPSDNRSYCAFDYYSAQKTFTWFALTKAVNGIYPTWANQFDIWAPDFDNLKLTGKEKQCLIKYFYSLCFAFGLAENRCVVTKFEKDNPVEGAPEVFVDNPLCPTNPESFWSTNLDSEIPSYKSNNKKLANPAKELVKIIKELYTIWNNKYCKGEYKYNVGLQDEPYFKYFNYADFLTPYSGLIQIKKYVEKQNLVDLDKLFKQITLKSKQVKDEIYNILINDLKYFE